MQKIEFYFRFCLSLAKCQQALANFKRIQVVSFIALTLCFGLPAFAKAATVTQTQLQTPPPSQTPTPAQNPRKLSPENLTMAIKRTQETIQKSVDSKLIPGCAIAVVYRDQIIFMNGYGVRTIGKPEKIDVDTVFQLGSVSKPIAATLASVLEQQGFLNLDDPVRNYLPNFTIKGVSNQDQVKVKNILSHTTGVPRGGFNSMIEEYAPYSKIVRALQTTRSISAVGTKYDYHNAMYGMIADITEKATNKPFPETLTTKLLRPLNMTQTSATLAGLMNSPNRATPHTRVKKAGLRPATPYSRGYYAVAPAGGINSSVRDMANFLKAQMGGYPEVVPPKALARIQKPIINTRNMISSESGSGQIKDASYGLGWRILNFADQKLVYHGGWVKGFTNFVGFLPEEKIGIVVLQNGDTKFSSKTAVKFFEIALGLPEAKASSKADRKNKAKNKSTSKNKSKVKSKSMSKNNKVSKKKARSKTK